MNVARSVTPTVDESFFLNDTAPTEIYTLSLHDALPISLILILDLRADGAGRFLKEPEILKAMENELAKLPAGDEVAILAMDMNNEDEERLWLTEFTNDRAKLAAALARVPSMSVSHYGESSE